MAALLTDLTTNEDAATARLLVLLEEARRVIHARIRETSPGSAALVLRQLDASAGDAILRVRYGASAVLDEAAQRAASLGLRLADVPGAGLFGLPRQVLDQLAVYRASLVSSVTDELRADITQAVQVGLLAGKPTAEIADEIAARGLESGPFVTAKARAEVIAVTELARVANMAGYARGRQAAESVPGLRKQWSTARDERVRESHQRLEGVQKEPGEAFSVGGFPAQHPHDPALPASQTARCRCRLLWRVPEGDS